MSNDNDRVELKAQQLESNILSGNLEEVTRSLRQEAYSSPEEFNQVIKRLKQLNDEDREVLGPLLPEMTFPEDGDEVQKWLALSKKVD